MQSQASPYVVIESNSDRPLRQCELLTNVVTARQKLSTIGSPEGTLELAAYPSALVISQDCDLDQDHRVRFPPDQKPSDKLMRNVMLIEVDTAEALFGDIKSKYGGTPGWKRVQQNNDPRFHFLQTILPGSDRLNEGLPEFVIDFKRYFTVPTDELYHRIAAGETQRRCALVSPYLEHLAHRFASYLSRVGLPTDHASA